MNATFIILYAGWPIRLPSLDLTSRDRASQFISEADAWFEIHRAGLNPRHCRVEPLSDLPSPNSDLRSSERLYDVLTNAVQPSEEPCQ